MQLWQLIHYSKFNNDSIYSVPTTKVFLIKKYLCRNANKS